MQDQIRAKITATPGDHVLKTAPPQYVAAFVDAATRVYPPERIEQVLAEKFGIGGNHAFEMDTYCQYAAELSVQNHLKQHPAAQDVTIEKKVNAPKDVDVAYRIGVTAVSLEIKCPDDVVAPASDLKIAVHGRIPDFPSSVTSLKNTLASNPSGRTVGLVKSKDNTLKDFLLSAHSKFSPDAGPNDLNVLLVACREVEDIRGWHSYLVGPGGLFTPARFFPAHEQFRLVDVVILSNLKDCHTRCLGTHLWDLRDVFLLPVVNPTRRVEILASTIQRGLSAFDHHLSRFANHKCEAAPAGEEYLNEAVKVVHYVAELPEEERQRYFPVG